MKEREKKLLSEEVIQQTGKPLSHFPPSFQLSQQLEQESYSIRRTDTCSHFHSDSYVCFEFYKPLSLMITFEHEQHI